MKKWIIVGDVFVIIMFILFARLAPHHTMAIFIPLSTGFATLLADVLLNELTLKHQHPFDNKNLTRKMRAVSTVGIVAGFVFVFLSFGLVLSMTWAHVPFASGLKGLSGTIIVAGAILAAFPFGMSGRSLFVGTNDGACDKEDQEITQRPRTRNDISKIAVVGVAFLFMAAALVGSFARYNYLTVDSDFEGSLTVMTYNVHQGYGMDGRLDPWNILEPIKRKNPDILFLQESDCNRISSMNTDLVLWLSFKLNMYSYFGPPTSEQIYGVATLSRFPLKNNSVTYLTSVEDQRVLVRSEVVFGSNHVVLYNIHKGLGDEDRYVQTQEVVSMLVNETFPVIMGGDFNAWPDSIYMEHYFSVLDDTWSVLDLSLIYI